MLEAYIDGPYGLTESFYYTASPGVIYYDAFPSPKAVLATATVMVGRSIAMLSAEIIQDMGVAGALELEE